MTDTKTYKPVVLQVLPALNTGGVERGTLEIAKGLTQAGYTNFVASSGGIMEGQFARLGVKHFTLPLASKNPIVLYRNIGRLVRLIRQHNVSIIHARSRAPAWSAYLAAKRTGIKFITSYHGTYSADSSLKRWYNSIMTKGDVVIAISEFIKTYIQQQHPNVMQHKIEVIPRGVDGHAFDPAAVSASRINKIHRAWNLPDNALIVMLPARLSRWKGQHVVIEAMAKLPQEMIICAVLVGGDQERDDYRSELVRHVETLKLQGKVLLVDDCHDMAAAYMLADIVVSASIKPEAFGRVIVEAQAMGRLVIAAAHGGALETIIDEETGWLVPPNDADALAKKILTVAAMPATQRQNFSHKVRKSALERFSTQQMVDKTLTLYQRLGYRV
jgi:glycosyltransferase involved in cell wall biosynthesis